MSFDARCRVEGCTRLGLFTSRRCRVHNALDVCTAMTRDELTVFKTLLADVTPMTDEERLEQRKRGQLDLLRYDVRAVERARARCLDMGIAPEQIEGAIAVATEDATSQ